MQYSFPGSQQPWIPVGRQQLTAREQSGEIVAFLVPECQVITAAAVNLLMRVIVPSNTGHNKHCRQVSLAYMRKNDYVYSYKCA